MKYKKNLIDKMTIFAIVLWSVVMLGISYISVINDYEYADALAYHEAVVSTKKDLAYRSWVASHGGVYVPITKRTPPNPYLTHIKNRDVKTMSNKKLTLMNPAYTLSQMMADYSELYGTKGHVTSRILMNPINKADSWEIKALKEAERTKKSVYEKQLINNEEYLRYLDPLVSQKSCLKCHAFQGYREGDIRGGVSVSVPLKEFYSKAYENAMNDFKIVLFIYVIGMIVIFYGRKFFTTMLRNKIKNYEQHIYSLVNIIEKRDSYTAGHSKRVAQYCAIIAKEMNYSSRDIDSIYRAGMLHDIGKISTPDSILLKPGRLSKLEFEIIREHVVTSYEILRDVDIYKDIAEIVRHHHEKYDGSGYPNGLKGDEIPMLSHIMILADAFDAMTTNRIYKNRKTIEITLNEIEELSEVQFHPLVVKASLVALKDIKLDNQISQRPHTKLEKERFAYFYSDNISKAYNKDYLEYVLVYNHEEMFNFKYVYSINLHNFTSYNDKYSWSKGDELLKNFTEELKSVYSSDFIFRVYGDDFIVLTKELFDLEKNMYKLENVLKNSDIKLSCKCFEIEKYNIKNIDVLEKLTS
ncbi:MAG: HD domain-containing protein [Campylobacterota bacterium]|nr:HD domain-containing protein [Campylobacterota bacterium]